MPNVRIKKAPRTGDQEDYALVHNDVATSESKPKEGVKNTISAVPRKEASIEVEGGESVVGDINQDGFLELMSFQGKRHSEGGMPVNIPDGSFIFSDTSKLKIKDPEILKYFGMGNNKKGYTPAQISKKYQVNEYIDTLKSDDTDNISKKTANEMLKNNTKKLAELAIIQESMKGLPNGVPDFAASVMPQMQKGGFWSFDLDKQEKKTNELYSQFISGMQNNFGIDNLNEKPSVFNVYGSMLKTKPVHDKSIITDYPTNLPLYIPTEEEIYNKDYIIPKPVETSTSKEENEQSTSPKTTNQAYKAKNYISTMPSSDLWDKAVQN